MTAVDLVLTGSSDYGVVALSVLIAILGSYTTLDHGERVTFARGGSRLVWLTGGCVAMGIGAWAMHYGHRSGADHGDFPDLPGDVD
jgi:NO-binding membrane sensor protein with MHYT domain